MSEAVEAEWIIESGERLLRLVLFRAGDRYAHRIEARSIAGGSIAVIESVEGDPSRTGGSADTRQVRSPKEIELPALSGVFDGVSEIWPASPPFQQFHEQEIEGRRAWFLVGMAGKSHWSASITALPELSGWEFDIACRYREAAAFLGSTYWIERPHDFVPATFCWGLSNLGESLGGYWVSHPSLPGGWMGHRVRLSSHVLPPASARWRYALRFATEP